MTRRLSIILAAAGLLALGGVLFALVVGHDGGTTAPARTAAVDDPHRDPGFSTAKRTRILDAVDAVTRDVPTSELAAQGRVLFRSNGITKTGESCQACHTEGGSNSGDTPATGSTGLGTIPHDPANVTLDGFNDFKGNRDAPALYGVGTSDPFGWAGDVPTLPDFALNAVTNHFLPQFRTPGNMAALVAYMDTFKAPTTDFDRGTMSAAALRGQLVFQNQGGCIGCHFGTNFTDGLRHDIGVPQPAGATDSGFGGPRSDGLQCGSVQSNAKPDALNPAACFFNTAGLRGVARTAPYFHNGIAKSLRQVVDFYDGAANCPGDPPALSSVSTIAPLRLTCEEKSDLVEFLKSL
jgi:cytochrome c peroxidase